MARITILGGTGYAGGNIAQEAAARGHEVTAVARRVPDQAPEGVRVVTADVTDGQTLRGLAAEADVIVSALSPRGPMQGRVKEVAAALIPIAAEAEVRVAVIGGAGGLKVSEDGPRLIDTDGFPEEVKPESFEMIDVLEDLEASDSRLDWFMICPASGFGAFNPGERTGSYRTGGDVLVTDEQGGSNISGADFAVAMLDEIERPAHRRTRFAVGY